MVDIPDDVKVVALEGRLLRASSAIYLACDECVASDVSSMLTNATNTIRAYRSDRDVLQAEIVRLRAEVDSVTKQMTEYRENFMNLMRRLGPRRFVEAYTKDPEKTAT